MLRVCLLFTILLIIGQPCYAYIDPATGSMLFSVFLGTLTTIFFLLQVLWQKIRMMFSDKKLNNSYDSFVIYSEGSKYSSVFMPILEEFERREISVTFYTSSIDDIAFKRNFKYVRCEYIGAGNKAYFKLSFLRATICLFTTPNLDVFQLKRSKNVACYCYIGHSLGDSCGYRIYGLDYFDTVLLPCDINKQYIREIETKRNLPSKELVTVGSPKLDYQHEKILSYPNKNNGKFTVLFAPSWGENSILAKLGIKIIDILVNKTDWNIIFRPHPQSLSVQKEIVSEIESKFLNYPNFSTDKNPDNIPSMSTADILITDFSGIAFEFAFLYEKPFVYYIENFNMKIYDRATLDKPTWQFEVLNKIGSELTKENVNNLVSIIQNLCSSSEIKEIKNLVWQYQGNGAKNVVDYMVAKYEDLVSKK